MDWKEYLERRAAWLDANGYKQKPVDNGIGGRGNEVLDLLDHGFTAHHQETGRRVLFGDPYQPSAGLFQAVERKYGLTIRQYRGLWLPFSTTLLEFWVDDPCRAYRLFADDFGGDDYASVAPLLIAQPGRFLGISLAEARRRGRRRSALTAS